MQMGTVIDEHAACTFEERVNRAISQGARLMHGNQREGALYSPTVLDHVRPDLDIVTEELFGPVSTVIRFDTIDDAIRIANSPTYGLTSGVCTNRLDYNTRFIHSMLMGPVNIRDMQGTKMDLKQFRYEARS